MFSLKDSSEYYLELSENPKRFEGDSRVTSIFFDDTNGQVFTVRSGGITGVSVIGMDDSKSTSFVMEDKGPIISIKFSLDYKILGIQRNKENQNATVEFLNFDNLTPTNVEYSHTCKWKNSKILGFVWPKANEITFVTDHGIELLQVLPEKKQLKSIKNTSFSGAWFSWCTQSKILVLAGNNGTLLQPFSLNNSTITKLPKLELESGRPATVRDVFVLRACGVVWCGIFKPTGNPQHNSGPTEVSLMPLSSGNFNCTHILKTGLSGGFAINSIDDLIIVHHQSSQTSLIFDIQEDNQIENGAMTHVPILPSQSIKPAVVDGQNCPMYSGTWVVFQPDYMIDARLGCLWKVNLILTGLVHSVPKDHLHKIVAILLRRSEGKAVILQILHQLVQQPKEYLVPLSKVFDEINAVYREWIEMSVRQSQSAILEPRVMNRVVITQSEMCTQVMAEHSEIKGIVQVVTAYISSLCRHDISVRDDAAEFCTRTLLAHNSATRLSSLVRRGCLSDAKPLSCQLLSLGHLDSSAAQLALDMMARLGAYEEIVEVLLSFNEVIASMGAAKQNNPTWQSLSARKMLASAIQDSNPSTFVTAYRALRNRDHADQTKPPNKLYDQSEFYTAHYKKLTE